MSQSHPVASVHWATSYIGFAYKVGAQGEGGEWDCWSFFRFVQRERFGRDVPFMPPLSSLNDIRKALEAGPACLGWRSTEKPTDGDAVFLSMMRHPTHIGIFVADLRSTLHCAAGSGSVLHDARHLAAAQWRVRGYFTPEITT